MVTQELINFIQAQIQQGETPDSIIPSLTSSGWQPQDIQTAFSQLGVNINFSSNANPLSKLFKLSTTLLIGLTILFLGISAVLGYWGYQSLFSEKNDEQNSVAEKLSLTPPPSSVITAIPTPAALTDCGIEQIEINLLSQPTLPLPVYTKLECFIEKTRICSQAKLSIVGKLINLDGSPTISHLSYYIKKDDKNSCVINIDHGAIV